MVINQKKLELAMARKCMNTLGLCEKAGMRYQAFQRITKENANCKPSTVGRIAKALEVDVLEIIDVDGEAK